MRLLLCAAIVALHVVNFTASQDAIVFRDDDSSSTSLENRFASPDQIAFDAVSRDSLSYFSSRFVKKVAHDITGNFVSSPYSVSVLLSLILQGANGYTRRVIRKTLHLPDTDHTTSVGFHRLTESLTTYNKVNLQVANGIFLFSDSSLRPEFQAIATNHYGSDVRKISNKSPEEASGIINEWCARKTQNTIRDLVNPDSFDANTKVVLVNAIYFKGTWLTPFDKDSTENRSFYINGLTTRETQKETMNSFSTYYHGAYPEVDATFVELPYDSQDSNHNVSMFVILPNNKANGIRYLEKNMEKITVSELIKRGTEKKVNVYLPKFEITRELQLKQPLSAMGLSYIFGSYANFNNIIRDAGLTVSNIMQKAFIKVDEEGSTASAATGAMLDDRISDGIPTTRFEANHPFYVIIATRNDNPVNLFTARYTGE